MNRLKQQLHISEIHHGCTRRICSNLLAVIAISSLVGCNYRPPLESAHLTKGTDGNEIVEVVLSAADAKTIKENEIYFSLVVVDCNNDENRSPIEPYIGGKLASNFDFPISGESVAVEGRISVRVLADFPAPCVKLQGGSYIFQKMNSLPVPLARPTR